MFRFFHRTPRQTYTEMDPSRKIVDFYRPSLQRRKAQAPLKSQSMAQKLPYPRWGHIPVVCYSKLVTVKGAESSKRLISKSPTEELILAIGLQ